MKKVVFSIVMMFIALMSCNVDDENSGEQQNKEVPISDGFSKSQIANLDSFEDLMDHMIAEAEVIEPGSEEVVKASIEYNAVEGNIDLLELDLDGDFYALPSGGDSDYTVTCCCNSDGGDLWSEGCSGKWSCGSLVGDCLDDGGCAEICEAIIYYSPQVDEFFMNYNHEGEEITTD